MTSYLLAARCRKERRTISRGSVSSHRDYGKRMPLSFNNEIQSEYYQNCSVSVEGASLEWAWRVIDTLGILVTGRTTQSRTLPRQHKTCKASCASMATRHSLLRD